MKMLPMASWLILIFGIVGEAEKENRLILLGIRLRHFHQRH